MSQSTMRCGKQSANIPVHFRQKAILNTREQPLSDDTAAIIFSSIAAS